MLFAKHSKDPYSKPHVLIVVSNTNFASETIVSITQDIKVAIYKIIDDLYYQMRNIAGQEIEPHEKSLFPEVNQEALEDYKVAALDVYKKMNERLNDLLKSPTPPNGLADLMFTVNRICADASGEITSNPLFDNPKVKMKHYGVMIAELDMDARPEFLHIHKQKAK